MIIYKAITCGQNQVYELRASCPKTCLDLNGSTDCGIKKPIESCYCKDGFVLDSNSNCIPSSNCGCLLPDNSGVISVIRIIFIKP
jgi:hypothetical protein